MRMTADLDSNKKTEARPSQIQTNRQLTIKYIYENGYYIPFLYPLFYLLLQNHLLTSTIVLKMLATNFYIHFGHHYEYSKYCPVITKPFMRLTDTGYIATLIALYKPSFFPTAFNIHFLITTAFFFAVGVLGMEDTDKNYTSDIDGDFITRWSYCVHLIPFAIFCYMLTTKKYTFDEKSFYYSVAWVLAWFLFIYGPFRALTGDCIYSILDYKEDRGIQFAVVILAVVFLFAGNMFGKMINNNVV